MFGTTQKTEKAAATHWATTVWVTEWSSTHWSHCSQGVLRASLMPLGTGSSLGCYFITPPYISTCRDPKIFLYLPKMGSKNNIARRTYFMKSRISIIKERKSNKCLITYGKQDPEGNTLSPHIYKNLLDTLLWLV